jgi:hypothetical protein
VKARRLEKPRGISEDCLFPSCLTLLLLLLLLLLLHAPGYKQRLTFSPRGL